MRERQVLTGDELRDVEFDEERILGECVTVYIKPNPEFSSALPQEYYIGHVDEIRDNDDYRHLKLNGTGVEHAILLSVIDRVEF